MKGLFCPYQSKPLFCQEAYCQDCEIYQRKMEQLKRMLDELRDLTKDDNNKAL